MKSPTSDTDPPADPRVEGAIEDLNSAIDALNILEDTKSSAEAAVQRGAALVQEELQELDRTNAKLATRVGPFIAARKQASDAIEFARVTENVWREAAEREATARAARKTRPKDAEAKQLLGAAAKQAKDAAKEAKRASRVAEQKALRLGELGEGLQRAGMKVPDAVRAYLEYTERRSGLEQVLMAQRERLRDMENAKEAATRGVGDAMGHLEALSNELHEQQHGSGSGSPQPLSSRRFLPAADGSPSAWLRDASWRPSREWNDDGNWEGDDFSEEASEQDDQEAQEGVEEKRQPPAIAPAAAIS